jgi:hypothetical protein
MPHIHRNDLAEQVREQGWVEGGRVVVMSPGDDDYMTPDEAREFGWKYLLAASVAEGSEPEAHGGPHICTWAINTTRDAYLLTGPPIGRTRVRLEVEYDDPVCADEAVEAITALLRLRDWWAKL